MTGRNHIHPAIHRVQDCVMAEPAQDWSLERLADIAALSERHLSRLFREHTGISVIDYVNLMRVNLARDILANSRLDMEAIAERAGLPPPGICGVSGNSTIAIRPAIIAVFRPDFSQTLPLPDECHQRN